MGASLLTALNILNYNLGSQAYSPSLPANFYVGLSTVTIVITATTGIGTVVEPATANGYTRVTSANNTSSWTTATTTAGLSNKLDLAFPTSSSPWGTILAVFLADSGTRNAGNVWWYLNLAAPIIVQTSTIITLAAGTVTFTLT